MSFQRILKPYDVWVPEAAKAAGFEDQRFANKEKAKAFVREVRKVCPDFNPILRVIFRYYDSTTGKPYVNRWEYQRDQESSREFREKSEAERKARDAAWNAEEDKRTGPLVPTESYIKGTRILNL
jgi:hypothetical protein